jgi:EmrB/QacA subfamily drug resistance transporter
MRQAPPPPKNLHADRRWLILGVVALAQLMVVLDVTIINIGLPSAQADLGFSDESRQWVITAYTLAFGSLLLVGGKISDLIGRKWTFIVGLAGFAGSSALGGAASTFEVLVGARALQGAFAAILAPAALSIVTTTFTDPGERGKAFAIYGAMASSGAAVGLLLGGFMTELLSWRWTMYVSIAFAAPAALVALRLLVNQRPAERARIDVPGVLVATGGLFALVYGLANAEMNGWGAPLTLAPLAVGLVAIPGFVALERRVSDPLLPLRVVRDRNRGGAFLAIAFIGVAAFAAFLFLTYYLQRTLSFSPIETGLAFLPMVGMVMGSSAISATRVLPTLGPKPLVPTGLVVAAAGLIYLTRIEVDSSYAGAVLPGILLTGAGFGMVMAPSFATATRGVAPADAGVASAMANTSQQIGGSLGLALLSTLFVSAVDAFVPAAGTPVAEVQAEAAVHGSTVAFWWAAGILVLGALISGALFRSETRRESGRGSERELAPAAP